MPAAFAGRIREVTTSRATLKPYLNEIRGWVAQGRTDVWIAHALNSRPASIAGFRQANGILRRDVRAESFGAEVPPPVVAPDAPPEEVASRPRRRSRSRKTGVQSTPLGQTAQAMAAALPEPIPLAVEGQAVAGEDGSRKRRRRGGRGRTKRLAGFEAALDHGQEGYGFWLDGAVADDPVFAEHWGDVRALLVRIEPEQIVIRRDPRAE
jgi:hypothetical protein